MRIVGVAFNVYISNRIGAEAMGLYSLITSVWGFALTLATSGINLAVTRCVAEAGERRNVVRRVIRRAVVLSVTFGLLSSLLLASFSSFIAGRILKDQRTVLPLRLLALSLPALSVSSALSGYFSAVRRVWKSAAAQLSEQAVRIYATASLLTLFLPRGPEYTCVALVLGSVVSDLLSCLLSLIFYLTDRRKLKDTPASLRFSGEKSFRKMLGIALPVAFSAYIRSGLTTLEHILIPVGLTAWSGSRSEALADYGILNGMVLPVVLFPYAFIYSFTGLLIPEIAGSAAENRHGRITYISGRMWRLTILLGFACSGILTVCSGELGEVLYGSSEAGKYIRMLSPLLSVMVLDTVTDSLLKGLGDQVFTMFVNIIDAALSVLLVWLLLPRFGINGYIAVLYISELINFSFSAARLFSRTHFRFRIFRWFLLPLGCIILTSRVCCFAFSRLPCVTGGGFLIAGHISVLLLLFVLLLRLCGSLDREYCRWIKKALTGKE